MNRTTIFTAACLLALAAPFAIAQDTTPEQNEKAVKYHSVLVKRPAPGYLFDRFYNAWLDTGSLTSLEAFLDAKIEAGDSTPNRLLLAYFHSRQGDSVRALEQFRAALKNDPDNAVARFQMAQAEARTLDFDSAIKNLQQALESEPKPELANEIRQLQGRLLVRNGQNEKAMEAWKKLLDENPGDEELREDLIELLLAEGLFEEAAKSAQELIDATKDPYQAVLRQMRLGDILQYSGKRQQAVDTYAACLEKVGSGTWIEKEIYAQIEKVFRREDDLESLKGFYEKLIEKDGKRVALLRQHSELLAELGDTDKAIDSFKQILTITPGDRPLREAFIDLLTRLEKPDLALEQIAALAEQSPDDAEIILREADLRFLTGDKEGCEELIAEFLQKSEGLEADHLRVCRLLDRYKLSESTDKAYAAATGEFPDSQPVLEAHAAYLHKSDRKPEAIEIWKKLAAGGDRSRVVQVARALATRAEHEAAFGILQERFEDFKDDPIYLSFLCGQAERLDKHAESIPWARRLILLTKSSVDLQNAITMTTRIADRAEMTDALITQLTDSGDRAPEETCLLADLLEARGDSTTAENTLQSIAESDPLLAATQLTRLYEQRREWHKAAELTEKIIELPGGRKSVFLRRVVELAQRSGDHELALKWLPEWKKISPGSTLPWLTESRIHLERGKTEDAVRTLRLASQEFEGNPDIRARLAQVYTEDEQFADAQRIYQQLYDEAEDLTSKIQWVSEIAKVAQMRGKHGELVERFAERRKGNRKSIVPLLALAEIYRVTDEYEDRRKALLEASRLKPDDVDLLLELARIEEKELDYDRALATLKSAVPLDKTTRTRERIARLHFNSGREDEAFKVIAEIAESENLDARSIEGLASSMAKSGDWSAVSDFLTPYLEKYPDDYRLRYFHALALEEDGRTGAARDAFLGLLEFDKELTSIKQPSNQMMNQMATLQREMRGFLPPEALSLFSYGMNSAGAYSHRANPNRGFNPMAQGAQGTVLLPATLESLRHLTIAHLASIATESGDDALAKLEAEVTALGVASAHLIFKLGSRGGGYFFNEGESIIALLDDYPDDLVANALAILISISDDGLSTDQLIHAHGLFETKYPQLAFSCAMLASKDEGAEVREIIDLQIEASAKIDSPSIYTVAFMLTAMGADLGESFESTLSDEQRLKLSERVVQWYPSLSKNSNYHVFFFSSAVGVLSQNDDPAALIGFLDREIEDSAGRPMSAQMMQVMSMAGRRSGSLLSPLQFPPRNLPGMPMHVIGLFAADDDNPYGMMVELDAANIGEAASSAKHPILRIVMNNFAKNDKSVEEGIEALKDAGQPTLDLLLLSAAYFGNNDQPDRAVDLLKQAQYLPMQKGTRIQIDSSIVAWAMAVLEDASPPDSEELAPLLTAARDAALRLRRSAASAEQRTELADVLEELGLDDEAEKLSKLANSSPKGTSSSIARASQQDLPERVLALLDKGKKDQAVRILANAIRNHARTLVDPNQLNGQRYQISRSADQLIEILTERDLTDDTLKLLRPDASASPRKRAEFAVVQEFLGNEDAAGELYAQLLETDPTNDGIRMRLLPILALSDTKKSLEMLRKLKPQYVDPAGDLLASAVLSDNSVGEEDFIGLGKLAADFLEDLERPEKYTLEWIGGVADAVSIDSSTGSRSTSFTFRSGGGTRTRSDSGYEMTPERAKVRDRLIKIMIETPPLAYDGFKRRISIDGVEHQSVPEIAEQVLLTAKQSTSGGRSSTVWYGDRSDKVDLPTPELAIVRNAWKAKNRASIDDILVGKLRAAGQRTAAEDVTLLAALYFENGEAFLDATKNFNRRRPGGYSPNVVDPMETAIDIWVERDLKVDLGGMLLSLVDSKSKVNRGMFEAEPVVKFASVLSERSGYEEAYGFLEKFAVTLLGDEETRKARAEKIAKSGGSGRSMDMQVYSFYGLMSELEDARPLTFAMLALNEDFADSLTLGLDNYGGIDPEDSYALNLDGENTIHDWQKAIESSPFLSATLEDFRSFALPEEHGGSGYAVFTRSMRKLPDDKRAEIILLVESHPQAFGRDLLLASLKVNPEALYEFLGSHKDAIETLPAKNFRQIAGLSYSPKPREAALSAEGRAIYHKFLDLRLSKEAEKREKFLKLDNHPDANSVGYEVVQLIGPLIAERRDQAREIYEKGVALQDVVDVDDYVEIDSISGRILDIGSMDAVAFYLELATHSDLQIIDLDSDSDSELGEAVVEATDLNSYNNTVTKYVSACEQLATRIRDPDTVPLLMQSLLGSISTEYLDKAVERLEEIEKGSDKPEVIREFINIAKLRTDSPDTDHYSAHLSNEETSLRARITAFHMLEQAMGSKLPAHLGHSAADLLARVWKDGYQAPLSSTDSILRIFRGIEEHDEKWNRTAQALAKAWRPYGVPASPATTTTILEFALLSSDSESVERIAIQSAGPEKPDGGWLQLLVKHRQFELAKSLLDNYWDEFGYATTDTSVLDDSYTASVEEFTATLDEPRRLFADLVLRNAPDPLIDSAPAREQRIAEDIAQIARRFEEIEITKVSTRQRLLAMIAEFDNAADSIPASYAEAAKGFDLDRNIRQNDGIWDNDKGRSRGDWHSSMYQTHLRQRVATEGAPAVEEALAASKNAFPGESKTHHLAISAGFRLGSIQPGILGSWKDLPPKNLKETARVMRAFHDLPRSDHLFDSQHDPETDSTEMEAFSVYGFTIVLHALSDEMAALEEWRKNQEGDDSDYYKSVKRQHVSDALRSLGLAFEGRDLSATERTDLVIRLLSDTAIAKFIGSTADNAKAVAPAFFKYQLLTMEEYLEHGDRIIDASPRHGWAAVHLAQHLHSDGQDERSLAMWDKALENVPESSEYNYTHFNLAKAELLILMDRHAEALQVVESLNPKRIHSGAKERIRSVTEKATKKGADDSPQPAENQ